MARGFGTIVALIAAVAALGAAVTVQPGVADARHVTCFAVRTTIDGTSGNDTIFGTNIADVIASFGGSDSIHALGGNDRVCAGSGGDAIYDGFGSDRLNGGGGIDTLYLCPDGIGDLWVNVERVIQSSIGCR
jgi:RTX calcium-binding nonapeptide repeat (4 copies)